MRAILIGTLLIASVMLPACAGTYCQSGAKGTQCYPADFAQNPPGRGGPKTDGER